MTSAPHKENRQETIAYIINEKRTTAREIRSKTPNQYGLELAVMLEAEADRIEAAEKREREAGAEAAQICGEIGEMVGREASKNQSVTNCNRLGNAAKMREALENIAEYAKAAACHTLADTIISDAYGHDRTEKDACLIAAAPELYEALRMYQEAFAEIRKSAWFIDANFHEIMSLNKVMTAADAALAKAAGESEAKDECAPRASADALFLKRKDKQC